MDSKINVAIRSYKRAGQVSSLGFFPFAKIWIPESQLEDYKKFYDPKILVAIPDEEDGNCPKKSNAILDRSPTDWILIIDDDIGGVGYWENNEHYWLKPEELDEVIDQNFKLADDLGVRFWGINQNKDPLIHYTYRPFSLLSPVLGPFGGHLNPELRYDPETLGKEDYDFWLQNIRKHRKTFRANKYHYIHKHGLSVGGLAGIRTMDWEKKGIERMKQKWGTKVFKVGGCAGGKSKTGKNILNSLVKVPIPGC